MSQQYNMFATSNLTLNNERRFSHVNKIKDLFDIKTQLYSSL